MSGHPDTSRPPGISGPWLTCQELVELVTDYVEDGLPAQDRLRFEEHVSACAPCRDYLAQMRATISLTGRLDEDEIDPAARDALLDAFRDWRTEVATGS